MSIEAGDGEGRLAFEEPELRLPWLESADEDEDEGLDWGRIGKFAVALLALLALLALGGLGLNKWLSAPPEGDGSLIEAPDVPYKVRPENPGGATVMGTGDTAYKVGDGRETEAQLAETRTSPTPSPSPSASPSAAPSPTPQIKGVGVQVGAYSTEADALKGWQTIRDRYPPLAGFDRRIVQGRADIGIVYRLQAVASDTASAFALCDDMRRNGIECQVKR